MQKTFGTSNLFKVKPIKKEILTSGARLTVRIFFCGLNFYMLQSQMQEQESPFGWFPYLGDFAKIVFHEDLQCIPYVHSYSRHIGESHVGTQGIHCFRK